MQAVSTRASPPKRAAPQKVTPRARNEGSPFGSFLERSFDRWSDGPWTPLTAPTKDRLLGPVLDVAKTDDAAAHDEAALLRARDPAYIEHLVRDYSPRMLGIARRILGCPTEAEDVVQEAFLSAFRAAERFDGGSLVSTWLHRITVNAALMRLRVIRRETARRAALKYERMATGRSRSADEGQQLDQPRVMKLVRDGVESLRPQYRVPLILTDIEGLSIEGVAKLLAVSVSCAKSRLHRARTELREQLAPLFEGASQSSRSKKPEPGPAARA